MTQESIENLFQSIDTIVSARIANLPYDQTIECEIINNDKAEEGEYTVQYQASSFIALSKDPTFQKRDIVYVQIPQGDFTQDKFILDKKVFDNSKKVKKLPFLTFIKNTNLIKDNVSKKEYNVVTSSDNIETRNSLNTITTFYDNQPLVAGYTKVGVKFAVKSNIAYNMASGNYGIKLILTGYDQTTTYLPGESAVQSGNSTSETRIFEVSIKNMIGSNFYNTLGYCNQEAVFDITNFVVSQAQIIMFQNGKFRTTDGASVANNKIYFTNISLYFGYDSSEFYNTNYKTFLYTPDGFLYSNEYYTKRLYLRFIEAKDDKTNLNILNNILIDNSQYQIHWEQYEPNSAIEAPWSKLLSYVELSGAEIQKSQILSVARNRLKYGFVVSVQDNMTGKLYTSNIIEFKNNSYLEGSQLLDLLTGFQSEFAEEEDEYNGRFFIYGQDSTSTNKIVSSNIHYILLSYIPLADTDTEAGLQVNDIITWIIPGKNTMIEPVLTNIDFYEINENGSYVITKTITDINADLDPTEHRFRVPYKIKDYYSNQFTNNTISFKLQRNENTFTTEKELLFGTSGSQGNEYNIVIKLYREGNDKEYINAITVTDSLNNRYYPKLTIYDYNNNIIELSNTWELLQPIGRNNNNYLYTVTDNIDGKKYIKRTGSSESLNLYLPSFIKYTITIPTQNGNNSFTLTSIYPIALTSNDSYTAINGSTVITYDITGKKPVYNKAPFQITKINKNESVICDIINFLPQEQPWAPILDSNYCLIAPSVYHTGSEIAQYGLGIKIKNNTTNVISNYVWIQPIYMHQNKYPIGYEQPELNQLHFSNYSVKDTLVGRLKNVNNKVSGLIMGTLTQNNQDTLGLYAFYENEEFFRIDENGYVYIGENSNKDNVIVTIQNAYITNGSSLDLTNISLIGTIPGSKISGTVSNATNATIATKLDSNAGSSTQPIYFNEGKPAECGNSLAVSITGNAGTATNYNATSGTIKTNFDRIKTAIEDLGGSLTLV